MLRGEGMRNSALQIHDADEPISQEKRNDELGTRFHSRLADDVTRIFSDVIDPQCAALSRGGSGKALMKRELKARGDGFVGAHGEDAFEQLGLLVPEHDAEDVVVDHFLDALGDAVEKFFALQDGGELAAYLVQEHERFGLLRMREEKTLGHRIGITQKGECIES